jgi:hypothetical protein
LSKDIGRRIAAQIKGGGDLSSLVFVHLAQSDAFDDVTVTEHADAFSKWHIGVGYAAGQIARYGASGALYKCLQPHAAQEDWEPPAVAALWRQIGDPGEEFPAYSEIINATDAYSKGDKMTYKGKRYISTMDGNVWTPDGYPPAWDEVT